MKQCELGCSKYKTVMYVRQMVLFSFGEECHFLFVTFFIIFYYYGYCLSLRYILYMHQMVLFSFGEECHFLFVTFYMIFTTVATVFLFVISFIIFSLACRSFSIVFQYITVSYYRFFNYFSPF